MSLLPATAPAHLPTRMSRTTDASEPMPLVPDHVMMSPTIVRDTTPKSKRFHVSAAFTHILLGQSLAADTDKASQTPARTP